MKLCGRGRNSWLLACFKNIPKENGPILMSFDELRRTLLPAGLGINNVDEIKVLFSVLGGDKTGKAGNCFTLKYIPTT